MAQAHVPGIDTGAETLASALSLLLLAALWLLHVRGSLRRPPAWPRLLYFHLAVALSLLAVLGPLDTLAASSTSMHMVQHMLMMVVIAPLWVLARPLGQLRAGGGGRLLGWSSPPLLQLTRHPMLAAWLHAAVIWFWHMPAFYMLALVNPWWHLIEHLCFLLTAGLFWWAVLGSTRQTAAWALLAVLFTLMHTGFLGALLTFAKAPLYFTPATVPDALPRTLADQQLAGLLMWVIGGFPYLAAAVWIGQRWYRQLQRLLRA